MKVMNILNLLLGTAFVSDENSDYMDESGQFSDDEDMNVQE